MLTIFAALSLEGWVYTMYFVVDASPGGYFNVIYFVLLILLGAWFCLNLVVAAIFDAHHESLQVRPLPAVRSLRPGSDGAVRGTCAGATAANRGCAPP